MLEFCDAPYQFFAPQPWKPLMAACRPLNRFLLRYNRQIHRIELSGEVDRVKELIHTRERLLITPNHPTRTDPQLVGEVLRQLGTTPSFMAAYDVFLESRVQRWMMQKTGCFSIDREGTDRKSMSTAIEILKKGEMALTIFPEGNVYQLNDRVTPIQDGPAFIAAKAQQSLGDKGDAWIVPLSLKYTHLTDVQAQVWESLAQIAIDSEFPGKLDPKDPVRGVLAVGGHLISGFLKNKTDLDLQITLDDKSPEEVRDELLELTTRMIGRLENELKLETRSDISILDRVRKIRSKIHQFRINDGSEDPRLQTQYRDLAEKALFTFRLLTYLLPYLSENPTLDRFAETVSRMREDYYSRSFHPFGPRKAMARIGEPISLREMLTQAEGKVKEVIPRVTRRIEETIQDGINRLNESISEQSRESSGPRRIRTDRSPFRHPA